MNPVFFSIGNFEVRWYSVLIIIGITLGILLVMKETKRFNIRKDFMINMLFWSILIGIIGARVWFVLFNLDMYSDFLSIFKTWEGGLAIHGGIIFGGITALIYCKKYKVKTARIFDLMVPALILAQAIGRWGNFFNSEAFGPKVSLQTLEDIKIIPEFIINGMFIDGAFRVPMFYFEFIWCILGFVIMLLVRRMKYLRVGQITGFYFLWYGIGRFFIEAFRDDSLMWGGFRVAQIVSVALFVIGLVIILIQSKKPKLTELYNEKEEIEVLRF